MSPGTACSKPRGPSLVLFWLELSATFNPGHSSLFHETSHSLLLLKTPFFPLFFIYFLLCWLIIMLQFSKSWNVLEFFSGFFYFLPMITRQFSSVQSLSRVRFFATPWTTARQASLSINNSQSLLKLMSIESVMSLNHLIFCCPLLLPPSIFPSIWVFPNESVHRIRWPKYWSFSLSISPSNEYSGLISFRMD